MYLNDSFGANCWCRSEHENEWQWQHVTTKVHIGLGKISIKYIMTNENA